jgi:hypothetical protein
VAGFLIPEILGLAPPRQATGGVLLKVRVSEIHGYPLRPGGFEEPLFPTSASRRAVMEHLLKSPWLMRASEFEGRIGESAHSPKEPVEIRGSGGQVELVRPHCREGSSRRRIIDALDHWREIREWWDEDSHVDRLVFRVLLSGGAVVNLALERSRKWFLVGVVD